MAKSYNSLLAEVKDLLPLPPPKAATGPKLLKSHNAREIVSQTYSAL